MVEEIWTLRRPVGVKEGECKRSENQSYDVEKRAGGRKVSGRPKERRTREKYQVRFIIDWQKESGQAGGSATRCWMKILTKVGRTDL